MTRIDLFTRDKIMQSLHLSDDKIAQMTGVKASTIRRIRLNNPPPTVRTTAPSGEPYNPQDTTEQTIAASARLRDAVRCMLNVRAKRLGLARPDWAAFDRAAAHRHRAGRI